MFLSQRSSLSSCLQHLRYAVVSAEYGSLRQAARSVVDAAASKLSRRIRELEESIFQSLCFRAIERRRLRFMGWPGFSPNGAVDSRTKSDGCAGYVSRDLNGRGEAGRLSVGFYTLRLSAGNLRATLVDFRQRCPQVALGMVERWRELFIVTALRNGAIDVVIATDGGHVFESIVPCRCGASASWWPCLRDIDFLGKKANSAGPTCGMQQ